MLVPTDGSTEKAASVGGSDKQCLSLQTIEEVSPWNYGFLNFTRLT